MTDDTSPRSPLETGERDNGSDVIEAFKILSNETRMAILLALWDAYDPHDEDYTLSFSELRGRVGVRDSGGFNYHLGKLGDYFVESAEDGYRLTPVGLKLVRTVLVGTGEEVDLPPTEIDVECPLCGSPTAIAHRSGWLYHLCTECEGGVPDAQTDFTGVLFVEPFSPAGVSNRTPEELFAAGVFRLLQALTMKLGGLCPECSGTVESSLDLCETHDQPPGEQCPDCGRTTEVAIRWICTDCKYHGGTSPGGTLLLHPAAVAFYHERGIDVGYPTNDFERSKQALSLVQTAGYEVVSTDPPVIRVTAIQEGDRLELTLDERLNVVSADVGTVP